eukprot:CAMPEP_0168371360 /NCGR_PEP_ID=MMETSP0228-20121227/7732_1 /TAXON_ID=133427 /ORGANISM="Protoceratium reticulatum, Strain CCCM 535 (=CCMP 1889)" /LENGTH=39 /DNA_ID= /DNA_START= /DNA_END= /DNA_ORIENTATION=
MTSQAKLMQKAKDCSSTFMGITCDVPNPDCDQTNITDMM